MSKKTNSLVFMLIATVLNLVLMVFLFIVGFVILGLLITKFPALEDAMFILTLIVFVGATFGSFFIYSRIIKWATAKFSLEDKLDPIFTPKRNRRKTED